MSNSIWLIILFVCVPLGVFLFRRSNASGQALGTERHTNIPQTPSADKPATAPRAAAVPHQRPSAATAERRQQPQGHAVGSQSGSMSAVSFIPQDATLRRHYLTHIRSMVESLAPPRPSDSTLRRHHEHLVSSLSDHCLHEHGQLEALVERYQGLKRQPA